MEQLKLIAATGAVWAGWKIGGMLPGETLGQVLAVAAGWTICMGIAIGLIAYGKHLQRENRE